MKREILFKAKRVDNGEWIVGDLAINKPTASFRIITDFALCQNAKYTKDGLHHISGNIHLVDPSTIGQFTGLLDKNGNKIFEGDKTSNGEIIVFQNGSFGTTYEGNLQGVSVLSEHRCKYMEIIGNIHD